MALQVMAFRKEGCGWYCRVVSYKVKFIQSSFQGARVEIVGLDLI